MKKQGLAFFIIFNIILSISLIFELPLNFVGNISDLSFIIGYILPRSELNISSEINYLNNLGGHNIYKLFNIPIISSIVLKSPINPYNNHHFLYMTLATSNYLNNMKICLKSAFKHGMMNKELLIISLDIDVFSYLLSEGLQTIFINYTSVLERSWFVVGRMKQAIQYYFNCIGVDVLMFESDMIFCNSFKDEMFEHLNRGADVMIMEEKHEPQRKVDLMPMFFGYNIGLMMVRSCCETRILYRRWLHDCYFTKDNLWDQGMFNFIVTNNAKVKKKDDVNQDLIYMFNLENKEFLLKFHFMNPVKYINYCSLIEKEANHFNSSKIEKLMQFASEMNLKQPSLLHFACINGPNKFTFMKNISLNEDSYEYHMNYLKNFKFVV